MIEVLVVCLGKTSKPVDKIITRAISTKNQNLLQPTVGSDNPMLSINAVGLGLESYQVWFKEMIYMMQMAARALEFGGDHTFQDNKNP